VIGRDQNFEAQSDVVFAEIRVAVEVVGIKSRIEPDLRLEFGLGCVDAARERAEYGQWTA
jgi:hypothetical protein